MRRMWSVKEKEESKMTRVWGPEAKKVASLAKIKSTEMKD